MKDFLLPLEEFIHTHLSQADCVSMVGHINLNDLLPAITQYLQSQYSSPSILTLKVKLLTYHSCLRNFGVCEEIVQQLQDPAFQSEKIQAEYWIARAYQYRNYDQVVDFELSEQYFLKSETCILEVLKHQEINENEADRQAYENLLFNSRISRFWLYAYYMNAIPAAEKLKQDIDDRISMIHVPAYNLAYYFFIGCYHLKIKEYRNAVAVLEKADTLKEDRESQWFFDKLKPLIGEKLEEAKTKDDSSNSNQSMKFFTHETINNISNYLSNTSITKI